MKKLVLTLILVFISSYAYSAGMVTKISGTDGNIVSADQDYDGTWHLGVSTIQDAKVISSNSSTTNLASGATFTGTSNSTLGVNSIQVSLKTDQNCTIYVEQSPDGTNWDISDSFNYYSAINNFGVTVQAVNSYFRVRVTNEGTTTTSYFRLQSVLCPVVEALPRSLNENGHLKVKTYGFEDEYGFDSENTPNGEMRVVQPTLIVGKIFEGTTIDSNFWAVSTSGTGTVTQANGTISLSTGTGANGSAKLYSVRRARYVPGQSMVARFQGQLYTSGTTSNIRIIGVAWGATMPTITDGAYFALDGTTLSVVTLKSGVTTTVSSGSFNGKRGSTFTADTNIHELEIYYNNRFVYFTLDGETLHTITASSSSWANTTQFHVYMENTNSGGLSSEVILESRSAGIRRLGSLLNHPTSKYQSGTVAASILKYGVGNVHGIAISGVTNNSVVTLWDNTAASGTTLWSSGTMATNTTPFFIDLKGLPFFTGLTLSITGANSNATVIYE